MSAPRRTRVRLMVALLLVAVLPLLTSLWVARSLINRATSLFFNADVEHELEQSVKVYGELARATRDGMRAKADAMASEAALRDAASRQDAAGAQSALRAMFDRYTDLVSLKTFTPQGALLAAIDRGRPVDPTQERDLRVTRALSDEESPATLEAVFAVSRARFDAIGRTTDTLRAYRQIEGQRAAIERTYLVSFGLLVGGTILVALALASTLARSVTRRIDRLARATEAVGAGDLTMRVHDTGDDEIANLAQAFNRMVNEVEESRARIEFLQRMGTWQEMARRLAHEIKNPLTPIQLAVQECHQRYDGSDPAFRKLLDTTQEIVVEEVANLRRLVSEFSNFARMPRANLIPVDFSAFLRDQQEHHVFLSPSESGIPSELPPLELHWEIPQAPLPVALDTGLFHGAIENILRNAAQAIQQGGVTPGILNVQVSSTQDQVTLDFDDNGPGIPQEARERVFEPYFTSKPEGTGLGLSIVKKIVVEHGGSIDALQSPFGGARIRIVIPRVSSSPRA